MAVAWVLEADVFSEALFDTMLAHLRAAAITTKTIRVSSNGEIDGRVPVVENPVVVYGSIAMRGLALKQGWKPGAFAAPSSFNYEAYRDALGDLLLNPDCVKLPLSEASAYLHTRVKHADDAFFIKPNGDDKEFAGMVSKLGEFDAWQDRMRRIGYLPEANFEVVISESKRLGREWRVVVVDGAISSASLYRGFEHGGLEEGITREVTETVMEAHGRFVPAPVYVIDVAESLAGSTGDVAYKVLEYDTFNSADLYACDVCKVIDDVTAFVERSWE